MSELYALRHCSSGELIRFQDKPYIKSDDSVLIETHFSDSRGDPIWVSKHWHDVNRIMDDGISYRTQEYPGIPFVIDLDEYEIVQLVPIDNN